MRHVTHINLDYMSLFLERHRGWPAFRTEDYFKVVPLLVSPGFGEYRAGMFIHHYASADPVPIPSGMP